MGIMVTFIFKLAKVNKINDSETHGPATLYSDIQIQVNVILSTHHLAGGQKLSRNTFECIPGILTYY